MGIFDRFPYSSTHEMNLDYMLGKATEIAEDMQTVTAGMAQVQAGLSAISEKTEQATQAAAQAAQSASSIEGSVTAAEEAAEEAQMHNESAQTWANNALTYKADCQRAATEAAASSSSAAQAATAAAASEDTVAQYAQAANASAQSAANNNDSAHQYANQASASASNATFHSSNAQTAATNANTSATNAETAATNAQTAATRTAALKDDCETLHRMCTAAVDQAATEAVNAANSAAQAAATKTDVETLVESLPEDFTDLNNTVNQLSDDIVDLQEQFEYTETITDSALEFDSKPDISMLRTNILTGRTSLRLFAGGKNLLVYPYFRASGFSDNGITYTVSDDGTITANGTATADSTFNINYYPSPHWLNKITYLNGCVGGSSSTYFLLSANTGHAQYDSPVEITYVTHSDINIAVKIKSGYTATNLEFKPMLAYASGTPYEKPGTLYTATVEAGTTQKEWSNIALRDGYNLILPQYDDTLTAQVIKHIDLQEINQITSDLKNQWKGKKWVAFGTSITDNYSENSYITQGDHAGEHTGKYVPYLLNMSELSESEFVNRGISGGSINGHILYYLRYYVADMANADLITIEGAVNDFASDVPLGNVGDTVPYTNNLLQDSTAEGTFAGACYQAFTAAITNAPKAVIVLLTETTGKNHSGYANYYQLRKNNLGLYQSDYIEMTMKVAEFVGIPVINCGRDSMINAQNPQYIADHIHHTYLGGYQYARTIWAKLKDIPLKATILPE